jgi:hypothetical protein
MGERGRPSGGIVKLLRRSEVTENLDLEESDTKMMNGNMELIRCIREDLHQQ